MGFPQKKEERRPSASFLLSSDLRDYPSASSGFIPFGVPFLGSLYVLSKPRTGTFQDSMIVQSFCLRVSLRLPELAPSASLCGISPAAQIISLILVLLFSRPLDDVLVHVVIFPETLLQFCPVFIDDGNPLAVHELDETGVFRNLLVSLLQLGNHL